MIKPGWLLVPDDDDLCPTFCHSLEELGRYIAAISTDDGRASDIRGSNICGFSVRPAAIYESGMRGVDDATA